MNGNRTLVLLPQKRFTILTIVFRRPVSRRRDNPIVHSAMSLSSLLKKEGKRSSPEGKEHVKLPKTKGFWPQSWLIAHGY